MWMFKLRDCLHFAQKKLNSFFRRIFIRVKGIVSLNNFDGHVLMVLINSKINLTSAATFKPLNKVWWSQKSRQFLVKNKTKHNYSRIPVLSACIDLRWRVIVQRLMKPLMIVKREVRSQIAHGFGNALVIFDVDLLVFDTAP